MPIYSVQAPDGRIYDVEAPAGTPEATIFAYVQQQMQAAPKEDKSGFFPALKSGYESAKGDVAALLGRTGVIDPETAKKYREDTERAGKEAFTPDPAGWGSPFNKVKELMGQSLPYMAAPLVAGAAASPLGAVAATAGAGLASAAQFTGSNLSRQMDTGAPLEQTNLQNAALAAIPQAALDTLSMRMIPGLRGILGAAGKEVTEATAAQIAKQSLGKTLADYAANTGKTMGAEGLTEAAQQVLERWQAGLNLTDEKARDEYWESLVGGAVLGGVLAPAGRFVERGKEQRQAEGLLEEKSQRQYTARRLQEEQVAQQKAQEEAAAEARKQSPEYATEFGTQYEQKVQEFQALRAGLKQPPKGATFEEVDAYKEQLAKLNALQKTLKELTPEYRRIKPLYDRAQNERLQQMEQAAAAGQQAATAPIDNSEPAPPAPAPAAPAAPTEQAQATPTVTREELEKQLAQNMALLQQYQQQAADAFAAGDAEAERAARQRYFQTRTATEALHEEIKGAPLSQEAQQADAYSKLQRALAKKAKLAGDMYDPDVAEKLDKQIADLRQKTQGYVSPEQKAQQAQQRTAAQPPLASDLEEQSYLTDNEVDTQQRARAADQERQTAAYMGQTAQRPPSQIDVALQALVNAESPEASAPGGSSAMGQTRQRLELEPLRLQVTQAKNVLNEAQRAGDKDAIQAARQSLASHEANLQQALEQQRQNEPIYTAEEPPPATPPTVRRAPGAGQTELNVYPPAPGRTNKPSDLRLYTFPEGLERPDTAKDLRERLSRALARDDLSDEAYDFLRRSEEQLQRSDLNYAPKTQREGVNKKDQNVRDTAQGEGFHQLLDQQLALIERGDEGVTQPGMGKTGTLQQFPAAGRASVAPASTAAKNERGAVTAVPGDAARMARERRAAYDGYIAAGKTPGQAAALAYRDVRGALPGDTRETAGSKADVSKVADVTGRDTLRGPSTQAKPLSIAPQMSEYFRDLEHLSQDTAGVQTDLFGTEDEKRRQKQAEKVGVEAGPDLRTATAKASPEEFNRLLNSPYVRAARKALAEGRAKGEPYVDPLAAKARFNREMPALQQRIADLQKQLDEKQKAHTAFVAAQQGLEGRGDLSVRGIGEMHNTLQSIRQTAIQRVTEGMRLRGLIDELEKRRREVAAGPEHDRLGSTIDMLDSQLEQHKQQAAELQFALDAMDTQMRKASVEKLREAAPFPYEIQSLQKSLQETRNQAAIVQQGASAAVQAETAQEGERRRKEAAVEKAKTEASLKPLREAGTAALQTAQAQDVGGYRHTQMSPEQRTERQAGTTTPVGFTDKEWSNVQRSPTKVLGGYRAQLRNMEQALARMLDAARNKRMTDVDKLRQRRDRAYEDYKAAKSADQRAELGKLYDDLDETLRHKEAQIKAARPAAPDIGDREAYGKWVAQLDVDPVAAKGMRKHALQMADLSERIERLDQMVKEGTLDISGKEVPREYRKLASAGERAAAADNQRAKEAQAAQARVDAPATSGEPLERSQARKAAQAQKTQYSSKGNVAEVRAAAADKAAETTAKTVAAVKEKEDARRAEAQRQADQLNAGVPDNISMARAATMTDKERRKMRSTAEEKFSAGQFLSAAEKDILFSRAGTVEKGHTLASLRKELAKALGSDVGLNKVQMFDTHADLIDAHPRFDNRIPTDTAGFVIDGKAYLIAENIPKGRAFGVLLHELGAHVGLRNLLNKSQYSALAKTVERWAALTDNSIEAQVGRAAKKRVEAAKTAKSDVEDEMIAYAVEEAVRLGVDPAGTKSGTAVGRWLKSIADALLSALRKFGLTPDRLAVQDLVDMTYGAAQLELQGRWHGSGKAFSEFDLSKIGQGEGAQVYGWGMYDAEQRRVASHYRNQEQAKLDRAQGPDVYDTPEFKEWAENTSLRFDGKSLPELRAVAAKKEGLDTATAHVPAEQVPTLIRVFEALVRGAVEDRARWKNRPQEYTHARLLLESALAVPTKEENVFVSGAYEKLWEGVGQLPTVDGHTFGYWYALEKNSDIDETLRQQASIKSSALTSLPSENFEAALADKKAYAAKLASVAERTGGDTYRRFQEMVDVLERVKPPDVTDFSTAPTAEKARASLARVLPRAAVDQYLDQEVTMRDQPGPVKKALTDAGLLTPETRAYNGRVYYANLARQLGSDQKASKALRDAGIAGMRFYDHDSRNGKPNPTYNHIEFRDKDEGPILVGHNVERAGPKPHALFSRVAPELRDAVEVTDRLVARDKSKWDKLREENSGLAFSTRYVDRFAGFEKLAKYLPHLQGTQMLYYLRMYDQRMNFVSQSVGTGALDLVSKTRKDGQTEHIVEAKEGASLKGVVNILKNATDKVGNADATSRLFTMYLAAKRTESKGFDKLHFGDRVTEADLKQAVASVQRVPGLKDIFEDARSEYNEYNRNLVRFVQKTGALSKEEADRLLASNDYIPYYRQTRDGGVELVLGGENPIRVGSIKEQPYLQELVGGDEPILDFMTSSVQNTNMLVDMGLRNLATKNAVFELVALDAAKITTSQLAGPDVVRFKKDGKDMYARIDTKMYDMPAEILVKGMEGIPLQMTGVVRLLSMPSQLLRKAVVLNPLYAARQLFRDSLAAPFVAGANFTPVLGALKEIRSPVKETLERRGVVGGQIFTGTSEDLSKILRDITAGKPGWAKALGAAEAFGMEADALTRRAQYTSYIKQGVSEMEATLQSLESMNFNKRGASPSVHMVNALIPFFNAQIQGLNVLYNAMLGRGSAAEKLHIQQKFFAYGTMMVGASLAYAAAMQDDEAYKNATPEQKYGNWFIRIPGVKEPLRLPVPFEVGYIFKALPEALYNTLANKHGKDEAKEALLGIMKQVIPGGTSYGIPQAMKPAIEAGMGKSFYTGRDIMSRHEQLLTPDAQYRENTTELAKMFGHLGVSPIKLEALVRGYTGPLGLALMQAVSMPFDPKESPAKAAKRLSDLPVVGSAFQPNDAGWIINNTYDRLDDAMRTKASFDDLIKRGERAQAMKLIQDHANDWAQAQLGEWYKVQMGKITQYEGAVRASDRSPDEKRKMLDDLRQIKIRLATTVRDAADRTTPQ